MTCLEDLLEFSGKKKGIVKGLLNYMLAFSMLASPVYAGNRTRTNIKSTNIEEKIVKNVIKVGPNEEYKVPSMAAKIVKDGDTVEIDSSVKYKGDVAVWKANNLTLKGVNGKAHLDANGKSAEKKAIWVIKGKNTIVENIEFSGCSVKDKNGAGIRQEGLGLIVRNCYFHDNENGILTSNEPEMDVLIEYSEFNNNGTKDNRKGLTHNMYIGRIRSFTLRYSHSHHAKGGQLVKSRARKNFITYNKLEDGKNGRSSFIIDLSNGGESYIIGNVIHQGKKAINSTAIIYSHEGKIYPIQEIYVVNNTFINERNLGKFIRVCGTPDESKFINNIFSGGKPLIGKGELVNNIYSKNPGFSDKNFHLSKGSKSINKGIDPGKVRGFDLTPNSQYTHKIKGEKRLIKQKLDIGAYEN